MPRYRAAAPSSLLLALGMLLAVTACSSSTSGRPGPCALLTRHDIAPYLPTVTSTQQPKPAGAAVGAVPAVDYCNYWDGPPSGHTPLVSVGLAQGHRTLAQLHAEIADLTPNAPMSADPRLPVPAYLQNNSVAGQPPDLELYLLKGSTEAYVDLRTANATPGNVERLARIALARL